MPLTDLDRAAIAEMRREDVSVLQPVTAAKLFADNQRIVAVFCGDGRRAHDIMNFHERIWRECHGDGAPFTHTHAWNGGGLCLLPNFPLNHDGDDDFCMRQLGMSMDIAETNGIALYAHAPCSAARKAEYRLCQVLDGLLTAKQRVESHFPNARVIPLFHVDKEPEMRTYFTGRDRWAQWRTVLIGRYWPELPA